MKSNPKSHPHFCPIPFLQLQLNPLGSVSACCYSGELPVGNIKNETIMEIWNSEKMQAWREEFLSGNIQICKGPIKTFNCHKHYQHLVNEVELSKAQKHGPKRLDLRLNGKCNLKCQMCDVWRQPNGLYDESDFWEIGPTKIFPFLIEVDMLGGEPFIQKDTYRFIDEVSKVNNSCTWGFITNAHYKFNDRIKDYLNKITLRHIHISLDSLNSETYKKIRVGGRLEKTLHTVEEYVHFRNNKVENPFVVFLSICVQKENWQELPEFLRFCRERNIQPILQNVITTGEQQYQQMNLASYSADEKNFVYEFLEANTHSADKPFLSTVYSGLE